MLIKRMVIDSVSYAYLDVSNVLESDIHSIDPNTLVFNVKTYANLREKKGEDSWIKTYRVVNRFFKEFTPHEKIRMARLYSNANKQLEDIEHIDQLVTFEENLSKELAQIFKDLKISKRIMDFITLEKEIFIPDLKYRGDELESAHHTKNMTFFYEDYLKCIAISVICKMLSPIFGQISNFVTNSDIDNSLKDLHAVRIMADLLSQDFSQIIEKIFNYIENTMGKGRGENDHTLSYHGNTKITLSILCYSTILVKNFVNNQYDKSLITDIYYCVNSKVNNTFSSNSSKSIVRTRIRPEDMKDDSESNKSRLETESYVSIAPIETPMLVNMTTKLIVRQLLKQYDLDATEFKENCEFYMNSPFAISPINMYIVCTFLGHRIGGAHGVSMLKYDLYTELLVLVQMYLCKLNQVIVQDSMDDPIGTDIIHCLSSIDQGTKPSISIIDNKIQIMAGGSRAYRNCAELFPYAVGNVSWDSSLDKIIEYLTTRAHKYNTAPNISNVLGHEDANNKPLEYNELIISNIFQFIHHSLKLVGHTNIFDEN